MYLHIFIFTFLNSIQKRNIGFPNSVCRLMSSEHTFHFVNVFPNVYSVAYSK